MELKTSDCIIVGGGPAGLTAAIYLARYHLSVTVFDDGTSRAASIPVTHNQAGFPNGINGAELLIRMRTQALRYGGVSILDRSVTGLREADGSFVAEYDDRIMEGRTILIATGVVNRRPVMSPDSHDEALKRGLVRYCPVCDGFEVTDKRVEIMGSGSRAYSEALFLRSYSREVTLLSPTGKPQLGMDEAARLQELDIPLRSGPFEVKVEPGAIAILSGTRTDWLDCLYPALGTTVRSKLAMMLGASVSQDGFIRVDSHQRTNIPGLYAAGDVVIGLNQISHSMGQAGVAATTIRNDLYEISALVR